MQKDRAFFPSVYNHRLPQLNLEETDSKQRLTYKILNIKTAQIQTMHFIFLL